MEDKPPLRLPLTLMAAMAILSVASFDMYQPALPTITKAFNTTHGIAQLTMSLFLLILGVAQLIWGPLVDYFGRRKVVFFSISLYGIATLICIFAPNIEVFILGRVLQSVGACAPNVVAFSSTRDIDDDLERARVISILAMLISISPIFSPVIGAVLLEFFGWQSNFAAMFVAAVIILLWSVLKLQESTHEKKIDRLNLSNVMALYKVVVVDKRFWAHTFIIVSAFSALMLFIVNASYILIEKLALTPTQFSIVFALNGGMVIFGNSLGIYLRRRWSLTKNIYLGGVLIFLGGSIIFLLKYFYPLTIFTFMPMLIVTCGVVQVVSPATTLALKKFKHNPGTATALCSSLRMSGAAIIAGIVGSNLGHNFFTLSLSLAACGLMILILNAVNAHFIKE